MLILKAVSNTPTARTLIATFLNQYTDTPIKLKIVVTPENVTLSPNLDGLEWILNTDRKDLMEEIRELVWSWCD